MYAFCMKQMYKRMSNYPKCKITFDAFHCVFPLLIIGKITPQNETRKKNSYVIYRARRSLWAFLTDDCIYFI